MEDAQQIQPVGIDPRKSPELFVRFHDKARGTLRLIPNQDYVLHPVLFACQQSTRFQRSMAIHTFQHLLPVISAQQKSLLHYIIAGI
jgi:hypothetical protein